MGYDDLMILIGRRGSNGFDADFERRAAVLQRHDDRNQFLIGQRVLHAPRARRLARKHFRLNPPAFERVAHGGTGIIGCRAVTIGAAVEHGPDMADGLGSFRQPQQQIVLARRC